MVAQKTVSGDSIEINPRKTALFLNNEVKDYAKYVIETRAMPNIMDGLRIGARKILWAALNGELAKKEKVKLPTLIGNAMGMHYNHGDTSLMNTIVQLSSKHVYAYAPLEVIGQIGTLRIPKCDTAPRYLHIKKSPFIDIFKIDNELLDILVEDGDKCEPKHFLPVIPISLLWRTNSPGFGFSYKSFSYDIDSIVDNCIKAINMGSCYTDTNEIQLVPSVIGIKEENIIYNANKNAWYNIGEYMIDLEKNTCTVINLPYNISLEKYEEHLNALVDSNYLTSFVDVGMDGNIKYVLKFAHGRLKLFYDDKWKFYQNLKLFSKIPKDILNVMDEDGKKMLFFDTPQELIDVFVKKRLVYYDKRKIKTIRLLRELITKLEQRIQFIELVIEDKLIINKRSSIAIKKDLDGYKLPHDVLKLNIDKLTSDEIAKMKEEISDTKKQLEYIQKTTIKEMYVNDLVDFKAKYSTINKIKV